MMGGRQMITVKITFRKGNKSSLAWKASTFWCSRKKNCLQMIYIGFGWIHKKWLSMQENF